MHRYFIYIFYILYAILDLVIHVAETSTAYLPSPQEVALKEKIAAGEFIDDTSFFTKKDQQNLSVLKAGFAKGFYFNAGEDTTVVEVLPLDLQPSDRELVSFAKETSPPTTPSQYDLSSQPSPTHHEVFSFFHHDRQRNTPDTKVIFHQDEHHPFREMFHHVFHSRRHHEN